MKWIFQLAPKTTNCDTFDHMYSQFDPITTIQESLYKALSQHQKVKLQTKQKFE